MLTLTDSWVMDGLLFTNVNQPQDTETPKGDVRILHPFDPGLPPRKAGSLLLFIV